MYPQPTNPSPSTSTSAPRPTSTFEPSSPQQLTDKQSTDSSPQSSLPCAQRTPAGLTSSLDAPSSHTPPQPFVHSQHQPKIPWLDAIPVEIPPQTNKDIEQNIPVLPMRRETNHIEIPQLESDLDEEEGQFEDLQTYLTHHNTYQESQNIGI